MTTPHPAGGEPASAAEASPPETVTAETIAHELGMDIHAVRRFFRSGAIPGRPASRPRMWTTTRSAYQAWLKTWPDLTCYDLTAAEIASDLGVNVRTARAYFTRHGAPGTKVRTPAERSATWRTTHEEFWPWYEEWTESGNRGPAS